MLLVEVFTRASLELVSTSCGIFPGLPVRSRGMLRLQALRLQGLKTTNSSLPIYRYQSMHGHVQPAAASSALSRPGFELG